MRAAPWPTLRRLGLLVVLATAGCAKTPPSVTEVEGVLLLDKKPLPNAQIEFVPELKDFGAEMNSLAVTDDKGFFRLTCHYKSQAGAVVGTHRVVVSEAPTPAEMRGMDGASQAKYAEYRARLKNRPIPDVYSTAGRTPLRVEVKPDQKTYEIELSRNP